MMRANETPDKTIVKNVTQKLMRTGTGSGRIAVAVRSGEVTLSGNLQYEMQRRPILNAATQAQGVRRVVDQMTFVPPPKRT